MGRATSAVTIVDTPVDIHNCLLKNNSSIQGGGIWVSGSTSDVTISNCVIANNSASDAFEAGGGIFVRDHAHVLMKNIIVAENSTVYANARGGGIFLCGGDLDIINSVIVDNGSSVYGNGSSGIAVDTGGLSGCDGGTVTVDSSIVFNNIPSQILGVATVVYSDVQGGYEGTGNISANPLFEDESFHLLPNSSPCIDSGNPAGDRDDTCTPPSLGEARNDMGAFGGDQACAW